MKRFLTILLLIAILTPFAKGQYTTDTKQVTVVYLLPLNSSSVEQSKSANMKESKDIDRTFAKSVIGFWCGAQIALDELAEKGRNLKVIAREVNSRDSTKLESIFEEEDVKNAQLIIAPVPKNIFPLVAAHAKRLRIPVVNPLSPNSDIINENSYVYKMFPHPDAKAAAIVEQFPDAHFIIWGKSHANDYEDYFKSQGIPYDTLAETSFFTSYFQSGVQNVVIACTESPNSYTEISLNLTNRSRLPDFDWVIPENMLNSNGFDLTVLSPFNLYFFSPFFVDEDAERVEVFRDRYMRTYYTLPSLKNFAYQGYDATCFFIELICNDFHVPKDFKPLSCQLKFRRPDKSHGFENYGIRLVNLKHLKSTIIQ